LISNEIKQMQVLPVISLTAACVKFHHCIRNGGQPNVIGIPFAETVD
jgi:hypothetical protein